MSAELDDSIPLPHITYPPPGPDEEVKFVRTSSVRAAHPRGLWLILFEPELPDGWTVGRIEVTPRGNIQLEIKPKGGGTS